MSQDSFWCIQLSPGAIYNVDLPESTELKITNACIVPQAPALPSGGVSFMSTPLPPAPLSLTRLYFQPDSSDVENSNLILLGTFIPNKIEHQTFQYTIQSDPRKRCSLQNISTGGSGEILHICGTISIIEPKFEYEEDEEDEEKTKQDQNDHGDASNFHYETNDDEGFSFGGQNFFGAFGL